MFFAEYTEQQLAVILDMIMSEDESNHQIVKTCYEFTKDQKMRLFELFKESLNERNSKFLPTGALSFSARFMDYTFSSSWDDFAGRLIIRKKDTPIHNRTVYTWRSGYLKRAYPETMLIIKKLFSLILY